MFVFALSLGVLSYLVFFLGLFGFLYKEVLYVLAFLYGIWCFLTYRSLFRPPVSFRFRLRWLWKNSLLILLSGLVFLSFIGALAPELAFDALWYHLTFPKLYLINHAVYFIPGGLFYYSAMPKLTEMLYTIMLAFGGEVFVKLLHFCFGLLSLAALYRVSRQFFSTHVSALIMLVFAGNLVFLWEATTAYIDLSRTFFEVMALWGFLRWAKTSDIKYFIISALLCGFAIATKVLAVGSLGIFIGLLFFSWFHHKITFFQLLRLGFLYFCLALAVPIPWFIFSLLHTGNPIYPIFSGYETAFSLALFSPVTFLSDFIKIFLFADDPVSPVYLITMPLLFAHYKKLSYPFKLIVWYSIFAYIIWYLTPRTGGGRFILPYLPAFSLVVGILVEQTRKLRILYLTLITVIVFVAFSSFLYRGAATVKYIPVLLGIETKQKFLTDHLQYSFGDFYDTDGYFAEHITKQDTVLLFGFHNIYYIDFPFIHVSWIKKGERFNYIATQHDILPERFKDWKKVYFNKKTNVSLYTKGRNYFSY